MPLRIVATALVVFVGVVVGGILGGFLGNWVGGKATEGCIEYGCLAIILWLYGGVTLGLILGGPAAWWILRTLERRLGDDDRQQP